MSNEEIEAEILAKNKTAPRITPEMIEDIIVEQYFISAYDGVKVAFPNVYPSNALKTKTICILVLKNGFTVTGESDCVSPENFDEEIGRKVAREKAKNKIWELEGYLLKSRMYEGSC